VYNPSLTFSQSNQSQDFQIFKTDNNERFAFPYSASNQERQNSTEYKFQDPILNDWILLINNNLTYSNNPEAKTVIQIKEPSPSEKFIEITMFGDESKQFFVAANTNETGYMRLYVALTHANVQGLSVSNGKRTVIDKLSLNGFKMGSIDVYGKDESKLPDGASGGYVNFEVLHGNPSQSPLYYLPLIVMVGVGGLVVFLLVFKKRRQI
jgi:hypothetical protein